MKCLLNDKIITGLPSKKSHFLILIVGFVNNIQAFHAQFHRVFAYILVTKIENSTLRPTRFLSVLKPVEHKIRTQTSSAGINFLFWAHCM